MSSSMTMPARFVAGDTTENLRRRFRRLPVDVQSALRNYGGPLHHHRLDHIEHALAQVGAPATLAWIGGGAPLCSPERGARP
jgi:hypothetical protein